MIICNMKRAACSDKITQNHHYTHAIPSSPAEFLVSFSFWFWFYSPQLYCFDSLSLLSSASFMAKKL